MLTKKGHMLIMLMILNQSIDDADQDADQGGAGPQHHQPRRNFDPVRSNNHHLSFMIIPILDYAFPSWPSIPSVFHIFTLISTVSDHYHYHYLIITAQ